LQGLGQEAIEELTLSDPRTGQTYDDDTAQIARNSSVVVKRTPGLKPNALQAGGNTIAPAASAAAGKPAEDQVTGQPAARPANGAVDDAAFGNLYSEQAVPEAVPAAEDEMQALLQQANDSWRQEMADSARATYGRGRGGRFGGRGEGGRFGPGGRGEHSLRIICVDGCSC
jgi:DWNN domain